jgi:hypothetical protein
MALSNRAIRFLEGSEREITNVSEDVIRRIFDENNVPVFKSLIDFQLNYSGYIFYAGHVPVRFTLLHGAGGYPESNYTAEIEFEINEDGAPRYYFACAGTDYQMQFLLDEDGLYYEDYIVVASSFEKFMEHAALWKEMRDRDFERVFERRQLDEQKLIRALSLDLIAEASDEYTQWYQNEFIYMTHWNGHTTLVASKDYPERGRLNDFT